MKISELTKEQWDLLIADNRRNWMAGNRPDWMADNIIPPNIIKLLENT